MQVWTLYAVVHSEHPFITTTGKFADRDLPDYSSRNFQERGFTVGIGG